MFRFDIHAPHKCLVGKFCVVLTTKCDKTNEFISVKGTKRPAVWFNRQAPLDY